MKKHHLVKAGLVLAAAMVIMTGCGKEEKAAATTAAGTSAATTETTAYVEKSAEELVDEASIKLGEYNGLEISMKKEEITEDYVQNELKYLDDDIHSL